MTGRGAAPRILCVGRVYCDLIFTDVPRLPSFGTEVYAGGLGLHAGGGAYITAAYLAQLGLKAALACHLPGAPFGATVRAELDAAGLDLGLCRDPGPETDPQITVAIAGADDRAFLTRRAGPAAPPLTAQDLRAAAIGHVHVGELATLLDSPGLIAATREAGATISVDCGWDDGMDLAPVPDLLARVDVFLPNAAEAAHLAAQAPGRCAAPLTVVKMGADGAQAIRGAEVTADPALPVQVVDTTGAGDAFNAGFLAAWLAGEPLRACLAAGNRLGAQAVSGRGGVQLAGGACPS